MTGQDAFLSTVLSCWRGRNIDLEVMLPWHFVIDGIKANILFIYLFTSIDSLWKVCNKCEGDINCAVFTVFTVSAVIFFLSHLFCKILKGYEGLEYWTEKRKQTCSHKGPITCITFCLWLRMKCSWKNKQTNKQKNSGLQLSGLFVCFCGERLDLPISLMLAALFEYFPASTGGRLV